MEESILSSPCKSNKSIRNVRNKRRSKRKLSVADNHEIKNATLTFKQYFYQDDDSPENLNNRSSFVENYEPFKMEKMLCMVDRVSESKLTKRKDLPQAHQGFLTCQSLTAIEHTMVSDPFAITDTELLNCCHEVDEMLMKTPPRPKGLCLANAILQDFSLSPLSANPETTRFWEYSPDFVFKWKQTKTYSRKVAQNDCNKCLEFNESICSDDQDCLSNNSSFLSIQENNSQEEDMLNITGIPDISKRLSENLLNLSAYYTQECLSSNGRRRTTSSETLSFTEDQEAVNADTNLVPPNNVVHLLQDICSMRDQYSQKKLRFNSRGSDEEFSGFSDGEQEISLPDDCGVQPIDETLLSQTCFHIPDADREMVLFPEDDNDMINGQGGEFVHDYKDEWNADCSEFALIKTQEILREQKSLLYKDAISNKELDSCKTNIIQTTNLNETHIVASKRISQHLVEPKLNINKMHTKNGAHLNETIPKIEDTIFNNRINSNGITNRFQNHNDVGNMRMQNIHDMPSTSKAAMKANIERNYERETSSVNGSVFCQNETTPNIGFQTSNGKNINISTKAQTFVEKLLNKFNNDGGKILENDLKVLKSKIIEKNSNFYTAKNKLAGVAANSQKSIESQLDECEPVGLQLVDSTSNDHQKIPTDNNKIAPQVMGFQTANGKMVNISSKAQKSVEKLLNDFCTETEGNNENTLLLMKKEIIKKNSEIAKPQIQKIRHKNSKEYWEDDNDLANVVFSEWPLEEHLQSQSLKSSTVENFENDPAICEDNTKELVLPLRSSPLKSKLSAFQTSGDKHVVTLAGAKNGVANRLPDIQSDTEHLLKHCIKFSIEESANTSTKMEGFQTAGGKNVVISAKAKKAVDNLLKHFQGDCGITDEEHDLIEIKKKLQSKNTALKATKKWCGSSCESPASHLVAVNSSIDCENACLPTFDAQQEGFQSAGDKISTISDTAKKVVANLLQDLQTDCDIKAYEQDLVELKHKMQSKNQELKTKNNLPSNELNTNNNTITVRENNDSPDSSFVAVKRLLDSESTPLPPAKKSLLLDAKQSFTELSVQSPLNTSATKSVISRKNLLSLSKKRKQRSRFSLRTHSNNASHNNPPEGAKLENSLTLSTVDHAETPVKSKPSSDNTPAVQTPWTPNINEFFNNAPKSSTPRAENSVTANPQDIENDLKPITWHAANKSVSKLASSSVRLDDSCTNITLNSSNPTVNERIGRLQMYGNAPAVSPITLDTHNHNCRPSGLRRTRSMLGKPNN